MLRAALPPDKYNCQEHDPSSSPALPSYPSSVYNGPLPSENLPTPSSSSSSPDLYLLRDSGASSSSSFGSPASGHHGFRQDGLLRIIDDLSSRSESTRGDHGVGLETELEDGFAKLMVADQGPKETLGIGLKLSLETQAEKDRQTVDEKFSTSELERESRCIDDADSSVIMQDPSLLTPTHLRPLDRPSATTLKSNLSFPSFPTFSSSVENSFSPTVYASPPSVPQTPFLRQVSSRSFVSTTTTTTTSCSPVQGYSSIPITSRTNVPPWQIELAERQAGTAQRRARAASVRSFHPGEEEQTQADGNDENEAGLRNNRSVIDITDSFEEAFPSGPRRRVHTTSLLQPIERPETGSIHRSPGLSTRIRSGFPPLASTSTRPSRRNRDRAHGPTKSAPNSSFNLAELNSPRSNPRRAQSRCRVNSQPSPATEPVHSGGGFREEVASLFRSFDAAATASGFRTSAGPLDNPSDQASSSAALASDQASKIIPRTVTDLIAAPVVPITQGFTLLFISLAAMLALSAIMMGSYGLTAWDEARLRLRDLRGRVQEGTRRIGEGVKEGRKLVDYAIEGAKGIGSGASIGANRSERPSINSDKLSGRPTRSSFVGRIQHTDYPFRWIRASFWDTVGRFSSLKEPKFQPADPTVASSYGGEYSRRNSSKKPMRSQKEQRTTASRDSPLSSTASSSASFLSHSLPPSGHPDMNYFASSDSSAWTTSDGSSKPSFQSETSNLSTDRSSTQPFPSHSSESPMNQSSSSGRAQGKGQSGSQAYPQHESKSEFKSQTQAKARKRTLPPRPPLRWLIPSIFLTLLVALGAMAYRFLGGKAEAHVGKAKEREKARGSE